MQIRKILIPLSGQYDPAYSEDLDEPALRMGLDAARKFGAHAEVLCVIGPPSRPDERWSTWFPGYGMSQLIDLIQKEGELRRGRTKRLFEKIVAACDPPPAMDGRPEQNYSTAFVEETGEIRETIGSYGRLSDLIVVASSEARWNMPFRPILESALRRTATPILVSPPKATPSFGTKVAVAWNDTVESARAVAASLDLLQAAQSVLVVSCRESEAVNPSAQKLVDYLAWHGIDASSARLSESPRQTGSAIVAQAQDTGCDLVVLGAYIHSRAHSMVFGSMTEHMLRDPKLPALLVP